VVRASTKRREVNEELLARTTLVTLVTPVDFAAAVTIFRGVWDLWDLQVVTWAAK
jgi:hypothetical protein